MSEPSLDPVARQLAAADPRLAEVIARIGPWSIPQTTDLFVGLCRSIAHQQLGMKAAAVIFSRFKQLCGGRPTPAAVAGLSDEQMRSIGLSRQKIAYLRDLSDHFAAGKLRPAALRELNDDAVIEAVIQVKGIGRWTADMLLMFSLGRLDVLPVGDLGLRVAIQKAYALRTLPEEPRMTKLARPWQPYRSVATWYLWRSLEGPVLPGSDW